MLAISNEYATKITNLKSRISNDTAVVNKLETDEKRYMIALEKANADNNEQTKHLVNLKSKLHKLEPQKLTSMKETSLQKSLTGDTKTITILKASEKRLKEKGWKFEHKYKILECEHNELLSKNSSLKENDEKDGVNNLKA